MGRHRLLEAAVGRVRTARRHRRRGQRLLRGAPTGSARARPPRWRSHCGRIGGTARRGPVTRELAYAAHRLEVEVLGLESGIQDQLCAAFGGISYLQIEPYPEGQHGNVTGLKELSQLLTLVFLGRSHDSGIVHRQVIEGAGRRGPGIFSRLREAAVAARDAVAAQDLRAFGRAMIANTQAQESLHAELVSVDAAG